MCLKIQHKIVKSGIYLAYILYLFKLSLPSATPSLRLKFFTVQLICHCALIPPSQSSTIHSFMMSFILSCKPDVASHIVSLSDGLSSQPASDGGTYDYGRD